MIKRCAEFVVRLFKNSFIKNSLSLYGVSIVNYLLPLAAVPYLTRVLGPKVWGVVVLAQSFGAWLSLVVEYGFSFSATREIAQHRSDEKAVCEIVASVLGSKFFLLIFMALIATIIICTVPIFREESKCFLIAFLNAVALGYMPLWYFQGIELLAVPSFLNVIMRALGTAAVFIWVKTPEDGWIVIAFQSGASIASTVILMVWLYSKVKFKWPKLNWIKNSLAAGGSMFVFSIASSIYSTANIFILGLFVSPIELGYYGGADKIHKAFFSIFGPISQALYPYIANILVTDITKAAYIVKRIFYIMGGLGICIGLFVGIGAGPIVKILIGPEYLNSVPILIILSLQIPLTGISRVLGVQWMIPLKMDNAFTRIVVLGGLINLVLIFILVPIKGSIGMALSFVLTELFIMLAQWYSIRVNGLGFWGNISGLKKAFQKI